MSLPKIKEYGDHKRCGRCHKVLPIEEFKLTPVKRNLSTGETANYVYRFSYCRTCFNERVLVAAKQRRRLAKEQGIEHYGSVCSCCGLKDKRFLTIDHINGRDKTVRRQTGQMEWERLRNLGWPSDIQLLCFNCNCAKGVYGICPHQEENK